MPRLLNGRLSGLCVALLLIIAASAIDAAKPNPAPVPPGKIIFATYANNSPAYREMNGDGSGKVQTGIGVPADPIGIPSYQSYFGQRWWLISLTTPATQLSDIYATNGTSVVQLTAAGQRDNPDGVTETSVRYLSGAIWSNNGLDSYCGFWLLRTTRYKDTLERIDNQRIFCRLDLSALELATLGQAALTPVFDGVFDVAPRLVPVLKTPLNAPPTAFFSRGASFSPDGNKLAFAVYYDNSENGADIYVADLSNVGTQGPASTSAALKIYENAGTWGAESVDWSRSSDAAQWRIAYVATGHVYTIRPDGTGLIDVVPSGAYPDFVSWSPDDKYLAFRLSTRKGLYYYHDIARVPASGGSVVNLTSDLGNSSGEGMVGWRP